MNINELKAQDPARFKQEYDKWVEHQCWDTYWSEGAQEGFKTDMALLGVEVEDIYFCLGYSQSDYASFDGRIDFPQWMKNEGYDVNYQALWLAFQDYGSTIRVTDYHNRPVVDWDRYYSVGDNTEPSGIFEGLDQDVWCELVESQLAAEPWEKLIDEWLREQARDLYMQLRDEYEYQTSEEQFIESCECNEVTFDDEVTEE